MKKNTKKELRINQRDRRLFQYLYENKIASVRQIGRDIFKSCHLSATNRRLRKLQKKGFLKEIALARKTYPFKAYSITAKAFDDYLFDQFTDATRRQFESSSLFHDIDLVDIRNSFAGRDKITKYLTENIIQSGSDHLDEFDIDCLAGHYPDAIVRIKVGKKYYDFCLEYEASLKSKKRCEDFLKKYYYDKNVAAVLFIYRAEDIFKNVSSLEKKLFSNMTSKFYYCPFEKIQSNGQKLQFTNSKNTELLISKSV